MISNKEYFGERPIYDVHNQQFSHIKIMDGESGIKECSHIEISDSEFYGKYPFWHDDDIIIRNSFFDTGSRAAAWYSTNIQLINSEVIAPKIFRDATGIYIEKSSFDTEETLWDCHGVTIKDSVFKGQYLLFHSENVAVDGLELDGKYAFQHVKNSTFRNIRIDSKDAFWNTKHVTVYDSVLEGEYLGWYSEGLKLVNCKIMGTQPLSYAKDLILENCEIIEGDLCFEHSSVHATIRGRVQSIKNPLSGSIVVDSVGELIMDETTDSTIVTIRKNEKVMV